MALVDLDADRDPDLVASLHIDDRLSVLAGRGGGTFHALQTERWCL
jgi:hypothetical protein